MRPLTGLLLICLSLNCARPKPEAGTLETGSARIHYLTAGSGPAVVLIHGWALSLREWDDQIAALSPHYRVVAFDRRGYGRSTGFADASADPGDIRALLVSSVPACGLGRAQLRDRPMRTRPVNRRIGTSGVGFAA